MIEVSRSDVRYDTLEKYPGAFLKLPIDSYLDLLGVEPNSSQRAIINAVNNPKYRFVCAAVSRRQGKTYIANIIGQLVTLIPGSQVLIMSPNYSLSQISFDLQRQLIKHFDLEVRRDNAKDKVIELPNGSIIRMGSVNQVDSTVGRSYDLIIFDEAALADGEDAFNVALRPTLDKENSKCLFISTPRGRTNWFSKFWERGFDPAFPEWVSIKATYHENPRISASDIEEAKKSMSEAEFAQEYLADFNTYEGRIWNFDMLKYSQNLSELDTSEMECIAGVDIGYRDATAFVVIKYDYKNDIFYIVDEFSSAQKTTDVTAAKIQDKIDKWDIEQIFADPAAAQVRADLAGLYDISTLNAIKDKNAGIAYVASLVENGKVIVDENCKHVLDAFDGYRWDPNPNLITEKPVHDEHSHMADAIRYALYTYQTGDITF